MVIRLHLAKWVLTSWYQTRGYIFKVKSIKAREIRSNQKRGISNITINYKPLADTANEYSQINYLGNEPKSSVEIFIMMI